VGVDNCQPLEVQTLGERLKATRLEMKLGTNELTRRAGISNGVVTRLEKNQGKRPGHDILARLAGALGVRVDWLVRGEEPKLAPGGPVDFSEAGAVGSSAPTGKGAASPPQSSPVATLYVVEPEHEEILEAAYKKGDFSLLSSVAARHMLRKGGFLVKPNADPVQMVSTWMAAATRLQRRGELVTPDAILAELSARIVELERPAIDQQNQAYREQLEREHGIKPEMPPLLQQARERAMKRETQIAEQLLEEAATVPPPGGAKAVGGEGATPKPSSATRKKGSR
jgi:transcriptional regulator with XRE-family HTH domain